METGRVAWSIVGAASPKWAKAVFPQLPQEEAVQALWQAIFKAARADGPAPVAAWREHQKSDVYKRQASFCAACSLPRVNTRQNSAQNAVQHTTAVTAVTTASARGCLLYTSRCV